MSGFPFLVLIGGIPLVGSVVVAAVPAGRTLLAKQLALVFALATLVATIVMCGAFDTHSGDRFQFTNSWVWIKAFGVDFALGVDGIALVLIALVAVLVPAVVIASWNDDQPPRDDLAVAERPREGRPGAEPARQSPRTFFSLLLLLEVMLVGVFAATDVFLFYVFFEAMLIPMYFIIGRFGGPRRQYAAVKFFLYSLFGGLLMLAAVIGLYFATDQRTFSFEKLVAAGIDPGVQRWLFLGFFIAFAIKAPLVLVLSVVGILYAALLAMGQKDMKRLVAYTSVAHFGFIGLGIFAFTTQGMSGAVFYMVNHGLSTGALFLVVGVLVARGGSRMISDYGGVATVAPLIGGTFLLAGLSSLALPGMSTFVSEFLVLVGTFSRHRVYAVIATVGIVFAALYILLLVQRTMHGPPTGLAALPGRFKDLTAREALALVPLLALVIFLGFYPKPMLDVITPAVQRTMQDAHQTDPNPTAGVNAESNGGTR